MNTTPACEYNTCLSTQHWCTRASAVHAAPPSSFHTPVLKLPLPPREATNTAMQPRDAAALLRNAPQTIPFPVRLEVFRRLIAADKQRGKWNVAPAHGGPRPIAVTVHRGRAVECGMRALGTVGAGIKGPLTVTYIDAHGRQVGCGAPALLCMQRACANLLQRIAWRRACADLLPRSQTTCCGCAHPRTLRTCHPHTHLPNGGLNHPHPHTHLPMPLANNTGPSTLLFTLTVFPVYRRLALTTAACSRNF